MCGRLWIWHEKQWAPQRCFRQSSAVSLLCRSFSVVRRNLAVWPHLSLLCVSESWGCNKKGSVTWILNLCGSSASPVKVNWGKRDKRHWLNSVAESEYFSGLETESPECYHLFLLLSSPLPPQVFLPYLIYLLLPVKTLEVCSGKWDKSSRINSTVHTPFPIQDLAHTLSCIAVAIYRVNVCLWSHSLQTATPSCQKAGLGGFSCLRTGWVLLFLELLYQASLEGLTRVTAACNHCYLQGRIKVFDRCTW